jgi:hypothetical protein
MYGKTVHWGQLHDGEWPAPQAYSRENMARAMVARLRGESGRSPNEELRETAPAYNWTQRRRREIHRECEDKVKRIGRSFPIKRT